MLGATLCTPYAFAQDDVAKRFIGTWQLVETQQTLSDGSKGPPQLYGPNGVGYLIYGEKHMCAVVGNPDRPKWKTPQTPTDQDLRSAFGGIIAYCGTYAVDARQNLITHKIEIDVIPNRAGVPLNRSFTFSGNRLILRLAPPLPLGVVDRFLTWERVDNN